MERLLAKIRLSQTWGVAFVPIQLVASVCTMPSSVVLDVAVDRLKAAVLKAAENHAA